MTETVTTRWSSNQPEDLFDVYNPATAAVIRQVQGVGAQGVDSAMRAAHAAYENDWRWRTPMERGAILRACAAALRPHLEEIAILESEEMGKPLAQARIDCGFAVAAFDYFGGLIQGWSGNTVDAGHTLTVSMLEPYGVVGAVIPFNWPPIHTGGKTAPALAAGNTIVIKPPEQAPSAIIRIVEIISAVLPPDVVHVIPGGAIEGGALSNHPLLGKISFTGSSATGAKVLHSVADRMVPATMELGGKNALIILDDADLDLAVACAVDGGFFNSGQACTASSRVLIHESLHDQFVERYLPLVAGLKLGDPLAPDTSVGPMASRGQQQKVLGYVQIGIQEGGKLAVQGDLPDDPALADGFWVPPTVLTGVTRDMTLAREEIFGPVVTVCTFKDEAEAISIANDTDYGLVAGIVTRDTSRALAIGRHLSVGIVFINNYNRQLLTTPFGGTKMSGYGREHCPETLKDFGYVKSFRMPSGLAPIPNWTGAASASPFPMFSKKP